MGAKKKKLLERVNYSFRAQHRLSRFIYPDGSSIGMVTAWMNSTVQASATPKKMAVAQFYVTPREVSIQNWKGMGAASITDSTQIQKYLERFGPNSADAPDEEGAGG